MSRKSIWRDLVVFIATAGAIGFAACDSVSYVDRVVVVNDTSYGPRVDIRGESGGWVTLTTVPAGESRTVQEVVDQGETWTFRFTYGVSEPVEVELARSALAEADWTVEVPQELEQDLRERGVPPPP